MNSALLPPDSCLVAVLLIIRSRDGPHFVFHYPRRPNIKSRPPPKLWGTELDLSESGSENEDEDEAADDLEDTDFRAAQGLSKLSFGEKGSRRPDPWDGDDHYNTAEGRHVVPWEHLFEFETRDLESILTPGRAYNKKKFILTLDPLTYMSYPVHIRKDGHWKKKKKRDKKPTQAMTESMMSDKTLMQTEGEKIENAAKEPGLQPLPPVLDDGEDQTEMTMFNVVFVTNPTRGEKEVRNLDMYEHVAKKINKALKYAQAQNNYVWRESETILGMKERAREERVSMSALWNKILEKSTLAQGLQDVYEAIAGGRIANIHFGTDTPVSLSVQIPMAFFVSSLPENQEPAMPGVWVTTATGMEVEDGAEHTVLNKHFALLLLDDQDKLIAEIQAEGGELAAPLIEYIKISKPTMSFAQVAQAHSISLSDIRDLAQHLIYWRRALAIPPLHHRDIYVASPNSDNRKLPAASLVWARAFPLAPPLPSFLATLSLGPRPYKTFAPSKVHRPTYMDMLAWLVRGGWVINLRTYVRIIVWPEIIYEVHHALDADILRGGSESESRALGGSGSGGGSSSPASSETGSGSVEGSPKGKEKERGSSDRDKSETINAAEAARLSRLTSTLEALRAEFSALPQPQITEHPSMSNPQHVQHIAPHIISDPSRAGELESLYLEAIARRLAGVNQAQNRGSKDAPATSLGPNSMPISRNDSSGGSEKVSTNAAASDGSGVVRKTSDVVMPPMSPEAEKRVKAFRRLQKYCDGRTALEMVGTMEGMKRKEVWNAMMTFEEYLIAVRHW